MLSYRRSRDRQLRFRQRRLARAGTHRVTLRQLYRRLFRAFGPQGWWPAERPFEVMVGAILTQATNWHNAERALSRLRALDGLQPQRLVDLSPRRLSRAVRPAGYFRQKTLRLKKFARWYIDRYQGRSERMFRVPRLTLREELLGLHGIGPETADAILLYAGDQPVFVVDAYTRRVFVRHQVIPQAATYEDTQRRVMRELPADSRVYNEFHALLVSVGKRFCHRQEPDCVHCPLGDLPRTLEVRSDGNW